MSLFVDTSVWSLAFRRDAPAATQERHELVRAIGAGEELVTTGLVLQELRQGFSGPRDRTQILDRFAALPLLVPDRRDHVDAAELRNKCRRGGIQIGTIDALLAQLCLGHDLTMLTADGHFRNIARHCALNSGPRPGSGRGCQAPERHRGSWRRVQLPGRSCMPIFGFVPARARSYNKTTGAIGRSTLKMRRKVMWTGAVAGFILAACTRVVEFAFGKAVAFTYAVVVGVIANLVFDLVHAPSHTGQEAGSDAVTVTATAVIPSSPAGSPAPSPDHSQMTEPENRPGPGSGGLY